MKINPRESLEAPFLRHGQIEELSKLIEKGEKPPYDVYLKFMKGEIDPPIDREETEKLIRKKIEEGKIKKEDFDIIICSPALRARQTSELVKTILGSEAEVHPSDYLREIKIPTEDITPEFYAQAENIEAVRKRFFESLMAGKKVDEDIVDVYKRVKRFLTYFHRIKRFTGKRPIFISHGLLPRFLEIAINHQGEDLSDDEIREIIKKEFARTVRRGTFEGIRLSSAEDGTKIIGVV